ncbi:MAG: hypothetical protein GY795_37700 [Desulfobacterales bacterium]|nr:hypothetical protein [Desulfobacterales bacterium]
MHAVNGSVISASVNRDLKLLCKYQLVRIVDEKIAGHGIRKIIEPLFGEQVLEFKVEI